jgi:hypothetical protein
MKSDKNPSNMTKEEIAQFFKRMYGICRNRDIYSVKGVISQLGFSCDQATKWASQNDLWRNLLNECRSHCEHNAERAGMNKILSPKIALRHVYENRYGFKYYGNSNELEESMFL